MEKPIQYCKVNNNNNKEKNKSTLKIIIFNKNDKENGRKLFEEMNRFMT